MRNEKRTFPRIEVDWPIIIETDQESVIGKSKDVSASGAFICCKEPVQLTKEFYMAFVNIPQLKRSLAVQAEVVRSSITCLNDDTMRHGIGVRFTMISDMDQELITTLASEQIESK